MQANDIAQLHFYQTAGHPCSYLPGQEARTVFLDPSVPLSKGIYSALVTAGFRRSGGHLYRPACEACQACLSARIKVRQFQQNKRFKRVWRRNQDLRSQELKHLDSPEFYSLYCRYINARHVDGDMHPPSLEQYQSFIETKTETTHFYAFYAQQSLVALSVLDELDHGLSAMYTFFDPEQQSRSLGTYVILWQVEKARRLNLPYVYLGYWIKECDKMRYKTDYRPLELLIERDWVLLT